MNEKTKQNKIGMLHGELRAARRVSESFSLLHEDFFTPFLLMNDSVFLQWPMKLVLYIGYTGQLQGDRILVCRSWKHVGKFNAFWIIQEDTSASASTSSEKWWLPVPCVPSTGLSEKSMKHLFQKRDCAYQIHKASLSINNSILAEMEIQKSYLATLPKNGKASVGDNIHHYMYTTEKFSPGCLLDSLDIGSEHEALDIATEKKALAEAEVVPVTGVSVKDAVAEVVPDRQYWMLNPDKSRECGL
ncbi:unnamed protein product [Fraxinus pennsylvanica]|uniref:PRONE domain-containing protein n=1 Tax=Fraxinus pennsylvanica TaxID=56036 RepID=A0AAD2DJM4_9LAMI|nr:unnamed protein product [Fraxinus pennsylvanica]